MNKVLHYCILAGLLLVAGCMQIPLGYTPGDALNQAAGNTRKYDVSFSVDYLAEGSLGINDGIASQAELVRYISDLLRRSGAFSRVEYKPFAEKSNYHLHFIAHYSTISHEDAGPVEAVMVLSLFGIPVWITSYLDMTAVVYVNQKPVYSPSTSEGLRNYVWIGFLPIGLVWNNWWAWTVQEKKCSRFLINQITAFQQTFR